MTTVLGISLVVTVVAYLVDGVVWTLSYFRRQCAITLLYGIGFTSLYMHIRPALQTTGWLSGIEFGLLLWLPTTAFLALSTYNCYDKLSAHARATLWIGIVKNAVAGLVAVMLVT